MKQQIRSLVVAIALLFMSLAIGIIGFMSIEQYNFVNALYMSVITISTVGFTEVKELSPSGRIFTSIYILANLGIFAYVVSVLTTYIFEGKLQSIFKYYIVDKELNKLKDHVIVCGYGRNGKRACEELQQEGRSFVVIDSNPEIRQRIPDRANFHLVEGDATEDKNLQLAGIARANTLLITTPSDAANVFITLTARELHPTIRIIARATASGSARKLHRAGANQVINPARLSGTIMAQMVTKPVTIEFLDLLTGEGEKEYHMESIGYDELKLECRDKKLMDLKISERTSCTVIGVKDNIKGLIPSPPSETLIGIDDTIIVLGDNKQLKVFREKYGTSNYCDSRKV